MPQPHNKRLYDNVVREAKSRFSVWPSAYASAWVVKEYKLRGGTYAGAKRNSGIGRWFEEKWVNVCEPGHPPCGRNKADMKRYPYCRPTRKVSKDTPTTVGELSPKTIKKRCRSKRKNPKRRQLQQ